MKKQLKKDEILGSLNNPTNNFSNVGNVRVLAALSVNLLATGLTNFYTVPDGFKLLEDSINLYIDSIVGVGVLNNLAGTFGINNPNYDNVDNFNMINVSQGQYLRASNSSPASISVLNSGSIIKINITTALTGTNSIGIFYLFGALVPN